MLSAGSPTPTPLQVIFLALSTICFAWISIGAASALLGFVALMTRGEHDSSEAVAVSVASGRTALLFPVYQEDPATIAAAIDTMCRDIAGHGAQTSFDIFILSDSQTDAARAMERHIFSALRSRNQSGVAIYCRWRKLNIAKKAGNIREWVEQFGAYYPRIVILDADSIMSAGTLMTLVVTMEDDQNLGLVQTVPRLIGAQTMFARLQQFAADTYGRTLAEGLAAWHGDSGNYWGHNAIIRTAAFAESAGLPLLSGKPPLGGHILSHDFVEAALLRRGGWKVRLDPSLGGSFEGCPPTLTDLVRRDRRWAQGNLQHTRLLGVHGLNPVSRVHLAMGAFSYLSSPIWALTLVIGVVLSFQALHTLPTYFGSEPSMFPKWPLFDAETALKLFGATMLVVFLPKLLSVAWSLRNSAARAEHGGVGRLLAGFLIESVIATLVAPILMVTQSRAVAEILIGRDSGWGAQRRGGATGTLWELVRQHRWHAALGMMTAAVCWYIAPAVVAWMSPIIAGLVFSGPLSWFTSHRCARFVEECLMTAEERAPPPLLGSLAARIVEWRDIADAHAAICADNDTCSRAA